MAYNISGLVYCGGESTRMGVDKGSIVYYEIAQRDHLGELVSRLTDNVYLSCHPARIAESKFPIIIDSFFDIGPMGGLLSAIQQDDGCAWLTVPCDMPLLDTEVLEELLRARDPGKMATGFLAGESGSPEPLFAIWERSALQILTEAYESGQYSLKKVLMREDCKLVESMFQEKLRNVNTREEYEEVVKLISNGAG